MSLTTLTEEQSLFCDTVERTVVRVAPEARVQKLDNAKDFDFELHRALAELGILGLGVSQSMGGSEGGAVEQVLAVEILGRMATSMAVFTVVQFMVTRLLRDHGTPEQREKYLAPLCRGEIRASFCLTEVGGGTDILGSMRTKATATDTSWVLNGAKMWISGATRSDLLVVLARTGNDRRGISMFLVPAKTPGVIASELRTLVFNSYDTCEVGFSDVNLPQDALLGQLDQGFNHVLATLNGERMNAAAVAIGIGRGAHQAAVAYARERHAFGRPIGQFQALQHRLVTIGVDLEAAWMLTMAAAAKDAADEATEVISNMAKLAASTAALAATDAGMEVMGGAGVDMDLPMQRYFRDIRVYIFAPLTNDMIRNLLAERWLGLPRSF